MALSFANDRMIARAPLVLGMIALAVLVAGAFMQSFGIGSGLLEKVSIGATTIFGLMAKIAGGVGFAALGVFVLHSRPTDTPSETQDLSPNTPEPIHAYEATDADDVVPKTSAGFGIRKMLIVFVGVLFLLGLAAVLSDFMGSSATGLNPA
ncbi:hypothetical protein L0666_07550 [Octadecabacter sp. CECT 8868]|uniref:hypothetical protein n=1 Tax=Octadecabacter algicola TaxID=2909342 RepID=UPI001F19B08D|nr:hypothetical protein [Octadecabacter algicola]MCF2904837.1 hypothetical protein [Octadecabacter algicola]